MQIETDILIAWGGIAKKVKKGTFIFNEGDYPRYYYQILEGTVKLLNINVDGKEFTQAEFEKGHSFGEPPLFIDEFYPVSAVTTEDSVIIKISKEKFLELLDEYPEFQKKLIIVLARRIYDKAVTTRELINNTPNTKILAFLNSYKKKHFNKEYDIIEIPYTRQEIANFTGLRVETVIRTLAKLKTNQIVKIENRKLLY